MGNDSCNFSISRQLLLSSCLLGRLVYIWAKTMFIQNVIFLKGYLYIPITLHFRLFRAPSQIYIINKGSIICNFGAISVQFQCSKERVNNVISWYSIMISASSVVQWDVASPLSYLLSDGGPDNRQQTIRTKQLICIFHNYAQGCQSIVEHSWLGHGKG